MTRRNTSETASQKAARVGMAQGVFRRIRLAEPRQHEAVAAMEQLRVSSIDRGEGECTRGLVIIQPSGSGKSESIKQFKAFVEAQPGRDPTRTPVLHVTLETAGTPRSAIVSCLEALGDNYAQVGTEPVLLARLKKAIAAEGVEIIVIDELNHCSQKIMGRDASNMFKNMLTRGWAPIVFSGTSAARRLFTDNRELRNRCQPQLSLVPLDHRNEHDLRSWESFLGGLDEQIVATGLLPETSGLGAPDVALALCETCRGLIGEVSLVVEDGLAAAVGRGDRRIRITDLHRSVDVRYVLAEELDANPLDQLLARR